eukprot:c2673_g1_i1.p1 GENE.c2673_g1_i1~~c2673_g1_i1.p1  ORF type:complete len:663 (-),score=148.76 c2673_g1_i1:485-2371(-)
MGDGNTETHSQMGDQRPFISRPIFWKHELPCPAMTRDLGFIRPNVDELMTRCTTWPDLCCHDTVQQSSEFLANPKDMHEFTKIFKTDAHRTFLSAELRRELVVLLHMLGAHVGDYHQSVCQIAAFLSLTLPQGKVLKIMLQLYHPKYLGGYFVNGAEMFVCDIRVWVSLLKRHHCFAEKALHNAGVIPEAYLPRWFMSVFVDTLPFHSLFDVFEQFLRHGIVFLFKYGLALINSLWSLVTEHADTGFYLKLLNLDSDEFPILADKHFFNNVLNKANTFEFDMNELNEMRQIHLGHMSQEKNITFVDKTSDSALHYQGEMVGGKRHGTGYLKWTVGDEYQGSFVNNMREGHGVHLYSNGDKYEGNWLADQRHGQGRLVRASGSQYFGEWWEGSQHGSGTYKSSNGESYTGSWLAAKKHGFGVMIFADGRKYEGEWVEDEMQGRGKITYPDHTFYEGNLVKSKPHGHGFRRFPKTEKLMIYEGQWEHGIPQGPGTSFYHDCSMFVGVFVNGVREGYGTWTFASTGNIYVGNFLHDEMSGQGKLTALDGSSYEGDYLHGQPHGVGVLADKEAGEVYEGEFEDGKRHGNGILTLADGSKYLGEFRAGVKHGQSVSLTPLCYLTLCVLCVVEW